MTNFLTDRIYLSTEDATTLEPEDYLSSALGVIFPDDITNQHGDAHTSVIYQSPLFGPIHLFLADPDPENTGLFSHFVWNAAVQLAALIEGPEPASAAAIEHVEEEGNETEWDVDGREVLELGAGTGLAGLVAVLRGARRTVITDYPAAEVLDNLRKNIAKNIDARRIISSTQNAGDAQLRIGEVKVEGHEWGILTDTFSISEKENFDRILVADCLWMPHQHINLLKTIRWFLAREGRAWVVAGFHTGREKMKGFYAAEALEAADLEIERIWEKNADGKERQWIEDRGREDITERKRWLVIGILKRRGS